MDGTVYLYYSAVSPTCSRSVCLATSTDGVGFTKHGANPVVIGGGPEVVYHDGLFHLFYWRPRGGGTARTEEYGSYLRGGKSQIGLATAVAEVHARDALLPTVRTQ